jgi:hypothetical protein
MSLESVGRSRALVYSSSKEVDGVQVDGEVTLSCRRSFTATTAPSEMICLLDFWMVLLRILYTVCSGEVPVGVSWTCKHPDWLLGCGRQLSVESVPWKRLPWQRSNPSILARYATRVPSSEYRVHEVQYLRCFQKVCGTRWVLLGSKGQADGLDSLCYEVNINSSAS